MPTTFTVSAFSSKGWGMSGVSLRTPSASMALPRVTFTISRKPGTVSSSTICRGLKKVPSFKEIKAKALLSRTVRTQPLTRTRSPSAGVWR